MHIKIELDLSEFAGAAEAIKKQIRTVADIATSEVAESIRTEWAAAIQSCADLSEAQKHDYGESLDVQRIDACSYEVVAKYTGADQIENGRPARDLKKMLSTSRKTRLSKAGKRYLIIPFRHQTTGHNAHAPDMPKLVYRAAKMLGKSEIVGTGIRPSANGGNVVRRMYLWMDRLPPGLAEKSKQHHKADRFAGMVRMKDAPTGGSIYLTFRVMHEDSPGWIVQAKSGLHIAQDVAARAQGWAGQFIKSAIEKGTS